MTNVNPETGIRYGIIAALSLDDEVVDEILTQGEEYYFEEVSEEIGQGIRAACKDYLDETDIRFLIDEALSRLTDIPYCNDEPSYDFELDGVKGCTTWLGGALMIWVFESPHTTKARLCSPCVPNCGDLDSLDENGEECYDVPPNWRRAQ